MKTFGNCEKHQSFPLVNCPVCEAEGSVEMLDNEIKIIDERINAGKDVISTAKEQLKILRSRKNELENLKLKISANP